MCVCLCEREREAEKKKAREREWGRMNQEILTLILCRMEIVMDVSNDTLEQCFANLVEGCQIQKTLCVMTLLACFWS